MRSPGSIAALAFALSLQGACATSPTQRPDEPLIDERSGEVPPAAAPGPAAAPPAAATFPPSPPGTIRRDQLKAVLAGSPGAFLGRVDLEASFAGSAFRGWRIRSFFAGDARLGGALRPGDVVLKVNDHPVERPEQFIEVWQAAGARGDLTVDVVRDARPLRLSWRIIDPG